MPFVYDSLVSGLFSVIQTGDMKRQYYKRGGRGIKLLQNMRKIYSKRFYDRYLKTIPLLRPSTLSEERLSFLLCSSM